MTDELQRETDRRTEVSWVRAEMCVFYMETSPVGDDGAVAAAGWEAQVSGAGF